jgi:cold shock protein
MTGTVKWFNDAVGYGFIVPDTGYEYLLPPDCGDVFVHHSHILGTGFRVLRAGEVVEFETVENHGKGLQAVNVTVVQTRYEARTQGMRGRR